MGNLFKLFLLSYKDYVFFSPVVHRSLINVFNFNSQLRLRNGMCMRCYTHMVVRVCASWMELTKCQLFPYKESNAINWEW